MSSGPVGKECSICELPLQTNEETVTTECDHIFHRTCAQQRLEAKHKSDCRTCGKPLVLANALAKRQTATMPIELNSKRNQPGNDKESKKDSTDLSVITSANLHGHGEENNWQCQSCSKENTQSTKRCEFCGEPQRPASTTSYTMASAISLDDHYGRKSHWDEKQSNYSQDPYEARAKDERNRTIEKSTAGRSSSDERQLMGQEKDQYDYRKHNYAQESLVGYSNDCNHQEDKQTRATDHYHVSRSASSQSSLRPFTPSPDRTASSVPYINPNLDPDRNSTSHEVSSSRSISKMGYPLKSHNTEVMSNLTTVGAIQTSSTRIDSTKETTQSEIIVYISNLPVGIDDNLQLESQIRRRLENSLHRKLGNIKCYTKLGIGFICVDSIEIKDRLINDFGRYAVDPGAGKTMISFVAELELVSYIVLEVAQEKKDTVLPTAKEMSRHCIELYKCEKLHICEQLDIKFPNIYKIVFKSLDELLRVIHDQEFSINGLFARIYHCANCSFFEDLPRSMTEDKIRQAIGQAIQQLDIAPSSLWVQLNKQTSSACILVTVAARLWSTKSDLYIDGKSLPKKNNLTCRLRVYPVPQSFAIHKITNHKAFASKLVNYKHQGENLILELTDKTVFDEYVARKALRIDDNQCLHVEAYGISSNPEASEIDEDTWYETEMLRCKPNIMEFIINPEHEIFRYKWNSQIWLKQFKHTTLQNHGARNGRDRRDTPSDQTRHQLRVTVMLNTLATVRKKSFTVGDQEINLKIDNKMRTIVYDQRSKLEQGEKLSFTKPPYSSTRVDVIKEDCLVVYERLVKNGYNPLLLNMANATNPGGGYRKGDGAQEENLFRRSDYFRSLDVGLDQWLPQRSERFHCSSNCQLEPLSDHDNMYPMHEFGAIYTSGLTVFRQSEDNGYAYMNKPLEDVCSLAMAAYRDPKLDGNILAPKYTVGTRKKIENIFAIAFHHKHDSLVLSALGCGAFKNPPGHVAQLFCSVIEQYAGFFKSITFAIIDDHNSGQHLNPEGNFKPFQDVFDGMIALPLLPMNIPHTMFGPYLLLSDDLSVSDVCILDKIPCNYGAKCSDMYNRKHAQEFSHPSLCPRAVIKGHCELMKNSVHMYSFIHRNRCQYGGECRQIDDEKHAREYDHPAYCPSGSNCHDMKLEHLKEYRHLPLCPEGHKCMDYQRHLPVHCQAYRHCTLGCPYGNHCASFHDKEHQDKFEHPFPTPCQSTPFLCKLHMELTNIKDRQRLSHDIEQHCLDFAHVCQFGRNCTNENSLHCEKSIHIPRHFCPDGDKCKKLNNEDHLNSFTHPQIPDIRELCPYADECYDRQKLDHITKFRHTAKFEHSGILRYFNLNKHVDFVRNQRDSIQRITAYIQSQKWKPLPSENIPRTIIDWIRTVQPVHRCNPIIFESILLHGHVMSREYMQNLKDPIFVANSVLQHSRIRRIDGLQEKVIAEHAKEYIIALVTDHFEKKGFSPSAGAMGMGEGLPSLRRTRDDPASYKRVIKTQEAYFSSVIKQNDLDAIYNKTVEIAEASINLHTNPSGIGYDKDKDLGTDKTVFSILGPHLGHYYGDVFVIFKRAILHHPDANFSIQAATSFTSGNAFDMRPWLGADPGSHDQRVKLYHRSKLNASIPGYDYATALELIALTSHHFKLKTMEIDLKKILERWTSVDSHANIEAHLPQLIPLSYIDHIYIPENLHHGLSAASQRAINANFKQRITIVKHDGEANQPPKPRSPTPSSKSRIEYQNYVIKKLTKRYAEYIQHPSRPIRGAAITIASTDFTDHYLLPLTIQQAYDQYCFARKHVPPDQTTYIYWQISSGDMILTLSNEPIESGEKQPNLRCLTCYIAPKPLLTHTSYYEHYSYLNNSPPFKHHILRETCKFAAKSNRFHTGCNTDDFMTFCLEIQRANGTVILTNAGPNAIYNHEKISCTFNKAELDVTKLDFVHISSGSRTVPVRNLMICFEKQVDLHPTFDKNFKKGSSVSEKHSSRDKKKRDESHKASVSTADDKDEKKSPGFFSQVKHYIFGDDSLKLPPCRDNINCLLQYSSRDVTDHNAKYSHPCRFSELCHDKESHLTHEFHRVSMCRNDKNCRQLDDVFHRAEYRHTDMPDFLLPCRDQAACHDKTVKHRIEYSHGEQVYQIEAPVEKKARASSPPPQRSSIDQRPTCKWGSACRDIEDHQHRKKYSHSTSDQYKRIVRPESTQYPCKYGLSCYDHSDHHRAKYSHPRGEEQNKQRKDPRTPCKYGSQCRSIADASHRAKYTHPRGEEHVNPRKDSRPPCKYGSQCRSIADASHRAKYSHQ